MTVYAPRATFCGRTREASARAGRPRHDRSQHAIPTGTGESAPASADVTAAVAAHVASVANRCATDADAAALRRLFLDNFIVSLWGATRPWTAQIAHWTRRFAGTGAAVLRADWTADASVAALVHGTASHSYELDDTHNETLSHPGAAVIPAALAVAASTGASQAMLFRAVAAGYEAMALVGSAAGGMETVHRGFHPTAIFGTFGAATACMALHAYRDDTPVTSESLIRAWGHALSQASGAMQFSAEASGGRSSAFMRASRHATVCLPRNSREWMP